MPAPVGIARQTYDVLPVPLRRMVSWVPLGWRLGPAYRHRLAHILRTDRQSAADLRRLQSAELARLLERACRRVPFYRDRYSHLLGRDPWEALRRIEAVTKQEVQRDPERFTDPSVPRRATYETSTGGTSGRPLQIVLDKVGFQIEWAFQVAQWMRAGYRPGMRKATFRGVAFPEGRLWQENPVYDEVQFSPFAMSAANLPHYVTKLREWSPAFLYGYPSALTLLARWLEAHPDPAFPRVRALLCGSEGIRPGQREYLERVLGARMFSWYGMSEKVVLAGECEASATYHSFPQYGITEILDRQGRLSAETGAAGELVGTGFINRSMTLIRYRTGDHSEIVGDHCESCGRHHLLLGPVRGRWIQEMVIGRSGAPVSLTALNMHGHVFKGIDQFQFHQREPGRCTLRVVAPQALTAETRNRIVGALRDKTGNDVDWRLEEVPRIELSPRGKGIFLVQELTGTDS
jgi:phenylacetate-CoA ligase